MKVPIVLPLMLTTTVLLGQTSLPVTTTVTAVPRLVRINSSFRPVSGSPAAAMENATVSIYATETGGTPLWQEVQNVAVDSEGRYSILLGSTRNEGLPVELFTAGEPRWLGVQFQRPGEVEQPRVLMASVPYALKAADAETLGGQPASAYLLAPRTDQPASQSGPGTAAGSSAQGKLTPKITSGTANNIAKFVNTTDLGNSVMVEANGKIGIGTSTPAAALEIVTAGGGAQFTNTAANNFTFNTFVSPGNASYLYNFGNLFATNGRYVQNSTLIDAGNILSLSAPTSLRFYTNGNNERMRIDSSGNLGIGTSTPSNTLEVVGTAYINATGMNGLTVCCSSFNGVESTSNSMDGTGILGVADTGSTAWGVAGFSNTGLAGHFQGSVAVSGTLTKSGGSFKIDHPLDPANKYLYHSFVESPDMMNVYNGNIVTDSDGRATVALPDYFEALNRDFRYQLTVIGQFAQAIIERKVQNNSFVIRSDKPNVEVSWQVTGIRQDAWANAHRIPVEEDKPAIEQGSYIHPELHGMPEERGVDWATHPDIMKRNKERRQHTSTPE